MVLRILVQNHLGTCYSGYQDRITWGHGTRDIEIVKYNIPWAHGIQDTGIESPSFSCRTPPPAHSRTPGPALQRNTVELWQMNLLKKQCCRPNTKSGFRSTRIRFQTWMTKTLKTCTVEKNHYFSNMTFLQFIHFRDLFLPPGSREGARDDIQGKRWHKRYCTTDKRRERNSIEGEVKRRRHERDKR